MLARCASWGGWPEREAAAAATRLDPAGPGNPHRDESGLRGPGRGSGEGAVPGDARAIRASPACQAGPVVRPRPNGTEEEPMTTTVRKAGTIIDLAQARQARERGESRPTPATDDRPTRASSQLKTTLR